MNDQLDEVNGALLDAAELGDTDRVAELLDAGANVTHRNEWGFDALSSALWGAHRDTAALLVARGAPITLEQAAALDDVDTLEQTWPSGTRAEPAQLVGPYLMACRAGAVASIRWLLDRRLPVDLHPSGEEWGGIGCPGLHHAAVNGSLEALDVLLAAGADVVLVDDVYGSTALAWAASAGHAATVDSLLAAGSDAGHRNEHGLSAADLARSNGWPGVAVTIEAHESGVSG